MPGLESHWLPPVGEGVNCRWFLGEQLPVRGGLLSRELDLEEEPYLPAGQVKDICVRHQQCLQQSLTKLFLRKKRRKQIVKLILQRLALRALGSCHLHLLLGHS